MGKSGELVHRWLPFRRQAALKHFRLREAPGGDDRRCELFEIALGDERIRVFQRNYFALLCNSNASSMRCMRLRLQTDVALPAAPIDRPAFSMEQAKFHTLAIGKKSQLILGLVEIPVSGQVPAILVGV